MNVHNLGIYNHCDVMKSKLNVQAIQKAVMYHPELQFIVFDISLYYNAEERGNYILITCDSSIYAYHHRYI